MIENNGYDEFIAARCLNFLMPKGVPWQRKLWSVGTVLALKECLEASEAVHSSILSSRALGALRDTARRVAGPDPGVGGRDQRRTVTELLNTELVFQSVDYLALESLLVDIESQYLRRWREALVTREDLPSVERASRLVASHLLDAGLSAVFMADWWRGRMHDAASVRLSDMLEQAGTLVGAPPRSFSLLMAFGTAPSSATQAMPPEWLSAKGVSDWLRQEGHETAGLRLAGGLLLSVEARDVWSAKDEALDIVNRIVGRVLIGAQRRLRLHDELWVAGEPEAFPVERERRGVNVKALEREDQLYSITGRTSVDDALELIGRLDSGPAAQAVASGWAAIESLLVGPGHTNARCVAAERLADIVACSFPRAELTTLAYAHMRATDDALSCRMRAEPENERKADMALQALIGQELQTRLISDVLAQRRMLQLLRAPSEGLREIRAYVADTFHRLYRQRNMTMHGGQVDTVCLRATLRTAAPLAGAGFDRIAHSCFVEGIRPLELAARGKLSVGLASSRDLVRLLSAGP